MIDTASLRAEMTRYGFTQKQMAESIGISPRTFSKATPHNLHLQTKPPSKMLSG